MTSQAILALVNSPWLPAHRKLRMSLWTWLMQDLEKIQQERMYHIVESSTWFAITIRLAKESLAELQCSNFFRMVSNNAVICCSDDNSIPTWHPRYLTGVPLSSQQKRGYGFHCGGSESPIHKPTVLCQLIFAPTARQKLPIAVSTFFKFSTAPSKYKPVSSANSTSSSSSPDSGRLIPFNPMLI